MDGRPPMQTRSRVLDDFAKVAGGAVSTLAGVKAEIEALVRQQIERFLVDADMVPRDEFDAVKAVAARARSEQESLEKRVRALEKAVGAKPPRKGAAKAAKARKPKPKRARKSAKKQEHKVRAQMEEAARQAARKPAKRVPPGTRKPAAKGRTPRR